jgi:hypothetical protein
MPTANSKTDRRKIARGGDKMNPQRKHVLLTLAGLTLLFACMRLGRVHAQQADVEPPIAYVTGNQISVYYPSQKKIYVYTQLGGNCVYAYTLTTPGGAIGRENCK